MSFGSGKNEDLLDPDKLALLMVEQYLQERGFLDALSSIERETKLKFMESQLPRGSMLMEMVYRKMEHEAGGDEQEWHASRAAAAEEALLQGSPDAKLPTRLLRCIEGLHPAAITSLACSADATHVFSGSGDGRVRRFSPEGELQWSSDVSSGGVLALAFVPGPGNAAEDGESDEECHLLATAMDGSVTVLHAELGAVLAHAKAHRKYVVAAAAVPAVGGFVTGSWDSSIAVHRLKESEGGTEVDTLVQQQYDGQVSGVAVLPDGATVVVSVSGSCFLRQFDANTLQEKERINMNMQDWDEHVSFSATSLALSPCGNFLMVTTDSPRILILRIRDWSRARELFGLPTAQFHQSCAIWHGSSHIIAAAAGGVAYCFHLGSSKVVAKVAAHPGSNVRAMANHLQKNLLFTGSFDRTVKVWGS